MAFGPGVEFVWSTQTGPSVPTTYAVRLENGTVKVYRNFAEYKAFKVGYENEGIYGGRLLAVKSKHFITFYDWEDFTTVRRIDITSNVKHVIWSEDGRYLILALEDTFYLLEFNAKELELAIENQ